MANASSSDQSPKEPPPQRRADPGAKPRVLERNVRALVEHAAKEEQSKPTAARVARAIWRFAGTMKFVYFHILLFGFWAALDLGWIPGLRSFDPNLTVLGTAAGVEAIFLAVFVLMAQLQMAENADTRNHFDLQVSLLAEQETTHILRLVVAIAERMGIEEAKHPEIQDLLRELEPRDVLERIEEHTDRVEEEIRLDRKV
jgi:uncharacterized membrane protein